MKRLKGIFTDTEPIDQPEGTYRYAKNIELNKSLGAIVSERGTLKTEDITGEILGSLLLPSGNTLLFVKNSSNFKIVEIDNDGEIEDTHLDITLDVGSYIQATFNINGQGNIVVYWVDDVNPPYFTVLGTGQYNTLFPKIEHFATFSNIYSLTTGGNLKSGAYYFALAYVDEDGNRTNFFNVSNPISVHQKTGEGINSNIPTSSSITLNITNIDTDYKKLRIVVIPQYQNVIGEVLQLPDVQITGTTFNYVYSGGEAVTISSLNEVIIDYKDYSKAKTIATSEGRLYLGNLSSENEIDYQKYAKDIKTYCVRKTTPYVAGNTPAVKTFKGDEVYAFYIAWVLKSGKLSKAFHIPGRATIGQLPAVTAQNSIHELVVTKGTDTTGTTNFQFTISIDSGYQATNNFNFDFVLRRIGTTTETFTTSTIPINAGDTQVQILPKLKTAIELLPDTGFTGGIDSNILTITSSTFFGTDFQAFLIERVSSSSGDRDATGDTSIAFSNLNSNTTIGNFIPLSTPTTIMATMLFTFPLVGNVFINVTRGDTVEAVYDKIINATTYSPYYQLSKSIDNTKLIITGLLDSSIYNNITLTSNVFSNLAFTNTLTLTQSGIDGQGSTEETADSLILGFNKVYQTKSTPDDTYKMGYWENENEFYPNDTATWGNPNNGGLAGQRVRHHKFPDAVNPEYRHYQNNEFVQLGVRFENIVVPEGLEDKVLGYKIFYAKRDDSNKTILDTATAHPTTTFQQGGNSEIRTYNFYTPVDTQPFTSNVQSLYPFNLLRTKKPISSISHLKVVGQLFNEVGFGELTPGNTKIKTTRIAGIQPNSSFIRPVTAASYIDFNEQDTLVSLGSFSPSNFRMDRTESRILFQTSSSSFTPGVIELVNLLTPKANVYNSFESQILVDTGYYKALDTNMDSGEIYNGDNFVSEFRYKNTFARNGEYLVQINTTVLTSEDNIYLRSTGDKLWQKHTNTDVRLGAPRWTVEREFIYSYQDGDRTGIEAIDNYIDYNPDYSAQAIIKPAFTYNTDTAQTVFNTRIIRNVDSPLTFRIFRPDDYIDLTSNRGELVKLTNYNNVLIPHLKRALVRTKGQEELQVNDIRAFLGSGDIFSVKPDEIIYTEEGFGGIQNIHHSISTDFGYFFIDKQARKVYRLDNNGINEISNNGMYNYFYNSIPSFTTIKWGYDPQLRRVLLSTNVDTLSYYPEFNGWVSFHDYKPHYFFRTYDQLYSIKSDKIYRHNVDTSYTLHGSAYDMVYNIVDNTSAAFSKIVDSVTIIGEVKDSNGQKNRIINTIKLSNSYQETDIIDIVNNNNFQYINTTRKTKNEWNINKFRQTSSVTGEYSWAYKKRIEDKFVKVDMTFTSDTDRIYIYGIIVNFKPSIR